MRTCWIFDLLIIAAKLHNGNYSNNSKAVYTTIASVLHLGNIEFEDDPDDNRGGCRVKEKAEKSLQITATLMGLDPDELR